MSEKDKIFGSSIKLVGFTNWRSFYKFCHDWLMDETGLDWLQEEKYEETLNGNQKDIDVKWAGPKKLTDYFRIWMEIKFEIRNLEEVEINKDGEKIRTNKGRFKISVSGYLERDYQGKFERSAFEKFIRGIYERWVIPSRIDQFEGKIFSECDEFLNQAKAFMTMEGQHEYNEPTIRE
jgi:hypothetical protein